MNSSQLSERLKNPKIDDFFVLDIDSTLVTTFQRNQAILDQFIKDYCQTHPSECEKLAQASCQLGDYGINTALNRIGFKSEKAEFDDFLHNYWRERFFTNDYLHSDQPTEGAIAWTNSLLEKEIGFVFLTARHFENMWPGTLSSLKALNFPIHEQNLILKEDLSVDDEIYKTHTLQRLKDENKDKTIWFIDNEPVVLHQIKKDHPEVKLVWFDSCHSGRMQVPPETPTIKSFNF
jgi:hypothetical protein